MTATNDFAQGLNYGLSPSSMEVVPMPKKGRRTIQVTTGPQTDFDFTQNKRAANMRLNLKKKKEVE